MESRILLFTGKGGVGKSTIAASTAADAAANGARTLMISTDTAHSLSDVFAASVGDGATEVAENLWVHQVDAQQGFEDSWTKIQQYLRVLAQAAGVDGVVAEELTVIPGADEVLALLCLREHDQFGEWDAIIVDCAPSAETLRLLALPEALGWYLERVMPIQRRLAGVLGPLLTRTSGAPMPAEGVFEALGTLHQQLLEVRDILTALRSSVRLVLTPETVVLAEARRAYTALCLYGYRVDGVVANRIFPQSDADPWRAQWVTAQKRVLGEVEESFAGLSLWRVEYDVAEPIGARALADLGARIYAETGSVTLQVAIEDAPMRIHATPDADDGPAQPTVSLRLPFLSSAQVDLVRRGGDLVVTIRPDAAAGERGSRSLRRVISLPSSLAAARVAGAGVCQGQLNVRFEPEEISLRNDAGVVGAT